MGPGGCEGREECEAFCNNPANRETCFEFAKEHGIIPPEDLEELERGISRLRDGLATAPPEVTDCVRDVVGTENLERILTGDLLPGPEISDQVRYCFENLSPFGPGDEYNEDYEEYREDYYGERDDYSEEPRGFYEDYEFGGEPYYDEYPERFDGPGGVLDS